MPPKPSPAATIATRAEPARRPRQLAHGADFAGVVRRMGVLVKGDAMVGSHPCLLLEGPAGVELSADLMPAIRPLPEPPEDLSERLGASVKPVRFLTGWGQRGNLRNHDMALAMLTTTNPDSPPSTVLLVTGAGLYLRYGDQFGSHEDGPLADPAMQDRLATLAGTQWVITAEAGITVERLWQVLGWLPESDPAAFAIVLPEGTELPAPMARTTPKNLHCPQGLAEPAQDAVEGQLEGAELMQALEPLATTAQGCMAQVTGAGAAGGRLVMALRIGEQGRAEQLCLLKDSVGDPTLAACVIEAARALTYPAPRPEGFVDVHLPLRLSPLLAIRQQGRCRAR